MISVNKAITIIKEIPCAKTEEKILLKDSLGHILARTIESPIDMPPFDQSAMDGYALNFQEGIENYTIQGEVQAGSGNSILLKPGQAVRIFTGAMVPKSANTVIQQEWASINDDATICFSPPIKSNLNIRPRGEQINTGEKALDKGHKITPASIGFLAGLGITDVTVYKRTKIVVFATGNELVKPGNKLKPGQIYESNAQMLLASLNKYGLTADIKYLEDDYDETFKDLREAISKYDLVLVSGGISVGDYDFVGKAFNEIGVKEQFYKVKQKPGKPLFFGTHSNTAVFGLPGNPSSTLTCFYIYVLPFLNKLNGGEFETLAKIFAPINENYTKKGTRSEFLKGKYRNGTLHILKHQSSAMLNTFAEANCLIHIDEEQSEIRKGENVQAYLIE